jgi:hypothetical protein
MHAMTVARLFRSVSFERVFKVVTTVGIVVTAVSFLVIASATSPGPRLAAPQDTAADLRWTTGPVRVAPDGRTSDSPAVATGRPAEVAAATPVEPPAPSPAPVAPAPEAAAEPEAPRTVTLTSPDVIGSGTLRADGCLIRLAIPLGRATARNDTSDPPPSYPAGMR